MQRISDHILAAIDRHRTETGLSDGALARAAGLHSDWVKTLRETRSASLGRVERLRAYLEAAGSAEVRALVDLAPKQEATPCKSTDSSE